MWAKIIDNEVSQLIINPIGARGNDGNFYQKTIFKVWSDADLKVIGFLPVKITNSVNTDIYKAQGSDDLKFTIFEDRVDGAYDFIPKDTLENVKAQLLYVTGLSVRYRYRDQVDDHYAEKFRTGTYTIPTAIEDYATALKTNYADYKTNINEADNFVKLGEVVMDWPEYPKS